MKDVFETTGGARVGWMSASWPFAKLTATPEALRLNVRLLGDYTFAPGKVVALTRYTIIPLLGWGIRIEHCIAEYPAQVIFWCYGSPDSLLARIRDAGFRPQAPASSVPPRTGMAFRWQAVVIVLLVWNGLFLLDMALSKRFVSLPGPFSLLAVGLAFVASLATRQAPSVQRLVLKPGRNIGEITPFLNLLLVISGLMAVCLAILNITR